MQHSDEFNKLCDAAKKNIEEISIEEAKRLMDTKAVDHVIDVRDQDEFNLGHIDGAMHLSKGWIEAKIHHYANQEDKIILYCGGGNRSALAAENLKKMGYNHVYSMIGGYKAWHK